MPQRLLGGHPIVALLISERNFLYIIGIIFGKENQPIMEQVIRDEIRRFVLESPDNRFPGQ